MWFKQALLFFWVVLNFRYCFFSKVSTLICINKNVFLVWSWQMHFSLRSFSLKKNIKILCCTVLLRFFSIVPKFSPGCSNVLIPWNLLSKVVYFGVKKFAFPSFRLPSLFVYGIYRIIDLDIQSLCTELAVITTNDTWQWCQLVHR